MICFTGSVPAAIADGHTKVLRDGPRKPDARWDGEPWFAGFRIFRWKEMALGLSGLT